MRQPYAILGASGSGKSSLLKAGVLPRLRRERGWLVLRTFRPGADPLFNFAEAIAQSFADHGEKRAPGTIRDSLRTTWDRVEKQDGFATDDGAERAAPDVGERGLRAAPRARQSPRRDRAHPTGSGGGVGRRRGPGR